MKGTNFKKLVTAKKEFNTLDIRQNGRGRQRGPNVLRPQSQSMLRSDSFMPFLITWTNKLSLFHLRWISIINERILWINSSEQECLFLPLTLLHSRHLINISRLILIFRCFFRRFNDVGEKALYRKSGSEFNIEVANLGDHEQSLTLLIPSEK